ncbi:MAG TPA: aldose 1-epimerase family protein [Solirubrobacteraceae bacterium]|nr:aldose 1-epimerase family protein [Solirubrobacteraceae bacterium]
MSTPPSGRQFELSRGEQRAVVVEAGGGIREYGVGERPVLESYALEQICDGAHGAPLIPWPNRIAQGRYSFAGREHQLALDEPARDNAIHGLLRWRPWIELEHGADRVVVGTRLLAMPGYPFAVEVSIAYELGEDGLSVTTCARNIGEAECPLGAGQHPYLSPGDGAIDGCTLQLGAATRLINDEHHQIPVGREPVGGTAYDYRAPRRIGSQQIDDAFTDLSRDDSGCSRARLECPDGATVELWVDERYPFLQVYSGDTLAPARRRRGLGLEPMTCAPNAFRSGDGLLRLAPGEELTMRWGVGLKG